MHTAVVGSIKAGLAGLSVSGQMDWRSKPTSLEFQIRLKNSLGQNLRLIGQTSVNMPHRMSMVLHNTADRSTSVFRLCVRGEHVNRKSDGKAWLPGTHLHMWSRDHGDKHAEEPWTPPWPPTAWVESSISPLSNDEMRRAFATFCGMLGISCDLEAFWTSAPISRQPAHLTMPDGEEVP